MKPLLLLFVLSFVGLAQALFHIEDEDSSDSLGQNICQILLF